MVSTVGGGEVVMGDKQVRKPRRVGEIRFRFWLLWTVPFSKPLRFFPKAKTA